MKKILSDKKIIITILSIILVLVVMSSTTYALFFKVHTMENTESYTAGILDIKVEEGSKLELVNSLPITDEEGATLTPYTFTITNVGNLTYTFDLKLLSTTSNNMINPDYIKIKLDDKEPVLLSSLSEGIIANDLKLDPGKSVTMSIRIWLSIDTPNTEIGKTFSTKIVTDGVGSEYVPPALLTLTNLGYTVTDGIPTFSGSSETDSSPYFLKDGKKAMIYTITSEGFVLSSIKEVSNVYFDSVLGLYLDQTIQDTYVGEAVWSNDTCTYNGTEILIFGGEETCKKVYNIEALGGFVSLNLNLVGKSTLSTLNNYGIYESEDDLGTSYYFRGNIENNYVKFAGYYWRIIRINGDGSIRMIYDGTSAHANGESSTDRQIGESAFNTGQFDNAYVGYMYGTPESSTYEETHANINDSTVKTVIDNWYKTNIEDTGYSSYVADAIYCNDREISLNDGYGSTGNGTGTQRTSYGFMSRIEFLLFPTFVNPSLKCSQNNDKFTVSSNLGNGDLIYPVGLITAEEANMAGIGFYGTENNKYYLYTGNVFLTMTPRDYASPYANIFKIGVSSFTDLNDDSSSSNSNGVRPVISLKSDTLFTGNGTMESPFEIAS